MAFYFITRPVDADKEIAYYRKKIAPSKLSIDDISEEYISGAKILYSSGTTMSLSISAEEAVLKAFELAKRIILQLLLTLIFHFCALRKKMQKESFNKIVSNVDILFMNDKYDTTYILELESAENIIKNSGIWGLVQLLSNQALKADILPDITEISSLMNFSLKKRLTQHVQVTLLTAVLCTR